VIVADAPVVVAALVSTTPDARWSESILGQEQLVAPHLLPVEVAHGLRRLVLRGELSPEAAGLAHDELRALAVELYAYETVADRVWELRASVSPYDAWYVGLAEELEVPLATLDRRLTRAPGPACQFLTPDGG
jgi:predicted nucleic acid-binding protein